MPKLDHRWMIRRDLPEVVRIEQESFPSPWTEQDFLRALTQRNVIGRVVEDGSRIVGFLVYELHKQYLAVANLAVDAPCRRQGVGRFLLDHLRGKLSSHRRNRLVAHVGEWNLTAHQFFAGCGFACTRIERDYYPDVGQDAYVFAYRVPTPRPGPEVVRERRFGPYPEDTEALAWFHHQLMVVRVPFPHPATGRQVLRVRLGDGTLTQAAYDTPDEAWLGKDFAHVFFGFAHARVVPRPADDCTTDEIRARIAE